MKTVPFISGVNASQGGNISVQMPQVPTPWAKRILPFGAVSDSAADIPLLKVSLPLCPLNQGATNSCGTTSLAMALNLLDGIQKGVETLSQHRFFTASQLDVGSREFDTFIAPGVLQEVIASKGFSGEQYNHLSLKSLIEHLQKNRPVIALINPAMPVVSPGQEFQKQDDSTLHYVVIHGVDTLSDPDHPQLQVTDPGGGITNWQPYETFRRFHWSHPENSQLSWNGLPTGLNQFALVVTQVGDPLPPSGGVPFQLKVAEIANRKLNQVAQLFKKWF